jgi:drug/metabolite transporter (DMT)-like permease
VGVTFWSLHILVIDRFVQSYSGLSLAVGQFLFCALFNFLTMPFVGEELTVTQLVDSAIPILYCGIFSSGIGFTFQIIGQKKVPATEASLLMSFEMIFGALSGFLILGEMMTTREFMGCILMTVGIFAAQIPSRQILRLS